MRSKPNSKTARRTATRYSVSLSTRVVVVAGWSHPDGILLKSYDKLHCLRTLAVLPLPLPPSEMRLTSTARRRRVALQSFAASAKIRSRSSPCQRRQQLAVQPLCERMICRVSVETPRTMTGTCHASDNWRNIHDRLGFYGCKFCQRTNQWTSEQATSSGETPWNKACSVNK